MNLKNSNGFTGVDITISLIIIIIFIPTALGIIYNINKTNNSIVRKTNAMNITIDLLETAKSLQYENVTLEDNSDFTNALLDKKYVKMDNNQIDTLENEKMQTYSFIGDNEEHYLINIFLSYPNNEYEKLLKVEVEYPVGNTTKTVEISTILKSN